MLPQIELLRRGSEDATLFSGGISVYNIRMTYLKIFSVIIDNIKFCDIISIVAFATVFYERQNFMSSLMRQINVVSRCAALYRSEHLKDTGLSACHSSYILTVCRFPGISQEQVSQHIYINKSNVTRQLAFLEENGFIERRQSETDRRVLLVYPTQKALDVLPFVQQTNHEWNNYITKGFSADELDKFNGMMERISGEQRNMRTARDLT